MSVSVLGAIEPESLVSVDELKELASKAGLIIPSENVEDFSSLLCSLNSFARQVMQLDYIPKVDFDLYPRTDIHRPAPEDRDKGGWAWKATVQSTNPKTAPLKGKTIALKDNIALAGVVCTNGTAAVDNWIPEIDATIVTRILDAGGVITGKAACENNCFGAVSDTSVTGPVHNPYADGYSTGGSSSGSGRLVASEAVDMAIGADQGGSIRLPSANCGLVGMKPTWGLVPYTGVISLEATIDHVGPMCKDCPDAALLLEVIAGSDGLDDRQPYNHPQGSIKYSEELKKHLAVTDKPLKGTKIGILKEGFEDPLTNANVEKACRAAVSKFTDLGAEVIDISVSLHKDSGMIWMVALPMAGMTQGLLANPSGRKQLLMADRSEKVGARLTQEAFDALGPGGQNIYLRGLFLKEVYGAPLHARCTNLVRKLSDAYDQALSEVDVLVMPTIIFPPVKIRLEGNLGKELGVLEMLTRTVGATYNTAAFNSTGHPALNLPIGFVPANDNESIKLPTGLQIVAKKFEDLTCLKVGGSWEQRYDWKTFTP